MWWQRDLCWVIHSVLTIDLALGSSYKGGLHFHANDRMGLVKRCGEFSPCNWNTPSSCFSPGLQGCFCIFLTYKCTPNLHTQCFYSSRNTFLPPWERNKTSFKGLISMHSYHKILEGSDPLLMNQSTTGSVGFHRLRSVALGGWGMHFDLSLEDQWSMRSQMGTLKF